MNKTLQQQMASKDKQIGAGIFVGMGKDKQLDTLKDKEKQIIDLTAQVKDLESRIRNSKPQTTQDQAKQIDAYKNQIGALSLKIEKLNEKISAQDDKIASLQEGQSQKECARLRAALEKADRDRDAEIKKQVREGIEEIGKDAFKLGKQKERERTGKRFIQR